MYDAWNIAPFLMILLCCLLTKSTIHIIQYTDMKFLLRMIIIANECNDGRLSRTFAGGWDHFEYIFISKCLIELDFEQRIQHKQ